jgi:hypothetical protein
MGDFVLKLTGWLLSGSVVGLAAQFHRFELDVDRGCAEDETAKQQSTSS